MSEVLLLIDLQHAFLRRPHLLPHHRSIEHHAQQLLAHARSAGHTIIHVRTLITRHPDNRMPHWKQRDLWHCEIGTESSACPPTLEAREGEPVLPKAGFRCANLVEAVTALQPDQVTVCGVMLHACVRTAVLDLHEAGLSITVASDAVGSDDALHAATTRRYLQDRSIAFLTTRQIVEGAVVKPTCPPVDVPPSLSRAQAKWRNQPLAHRSAFIPELSRLLLHHRHALALQMASEIHKPLRYAEVEVERTAAMAQAIVQRLTPALAATEPAPTQVRFRPHGVVAVITPWNNPVYIALGKILPALLCGNAVIWKPAPEAAAISDRVHQILLAAGLDPALLAIVHGGADTGMAIMNHPEIGAVTITGSLAAGSSAADLCHRHHLPLQAELGGNNPAIVWDDADFDAAALQIAKGAFEMAGQRCTANRRVIVSSRLRAKLLDRLTRATAQLIAGTADDPATHIGPLVSAAAWDRVTAQIQRAEADGLVIHRPLPAPSSPIESWCPPVIIECDDPPHEIVQQESFGPVLVIQTCRDWDHAIALANGVSQGLASALFSESSDRITDFLDRAQAGILKVNQSTADAAIDQPFGGWKGSGMGPPEHGDADIAFFTRMQTVYGQPPRPA